MFPKSMCEAADEKFANFAPGYRRDYYEGASHGFATRGDPVRVHVFSHGYPEVHSTCPRTEQADGKGRQGRRFQGVRAVVDQIPAVKRRPRRESDDDQ
jgi:hypothetical protein